MKKSSTSPYRKVILKPKHILKLFVEVKLQRLWVFVLQGWLNNGLVNYIHFNSVLF